MATTLSILEAFVLNDIKHDIEIIWENEEPYIRATDIAKILELKNIHTSISKFKPKHTALRKTYCTNGWHDILYFTESGLYKMLMISRKPIAEKFQDWIEDVIKNIRKTGKYELELQQTKLNETIQEQIQIALKVEADKYKLIEYKTKHETLIDVYSNKNVVYFGYVKIEEENTNRVKIKIGSTCDISGRSNTHTANFGTYYLFHVIETPMHERFEQFLHKHEMIKKYKDTKYTYIDKDSKEHHSIEIYDIEKSYIKTILDIAKRNHPKFKDVATMDQIITYNNQEIEKTRELTKLATIEYNTIKAEVQNLQENNTPIEPERIYIEDSRKITVGRGDKIQIYNPETSELVYTFNTLIDVTRDNQYVLNSSRPMILNALSKNIEYKNYRWLRLDRELLDNTVQILPPAGDNTKHVNIGHIAMINLDKTRIEKVFPDMLSASADRQFKTDAAISKAIRQQTKSGGHYFMMWTNCTDELKTEYLSRETLPEKPVRANSIQVNKIDPINNTIIQTYKCQEDIIKEYKIGRKSLKDAIEHNYILKGFKWQIL